MIDACQKTSDLFAFMTPQLGVALASGNATLGQGGALGGVLRLAVDVRATALNGAIPKVDEITPGTAGATRNTYAVESRVVGFPVASAAVGVFPGIRVGAMRVLGVDGLISAAYVPAIHQSALSIETTDGSLKLGYGGRVGLLEERRYLPGVSATYLTRQLPTLNIAGTISSDVGVDTIGLDHLTMKTAGWRITASKRLSLLTIAGGYGHDTYKASANGRIALSDGYACATPCQGSFGLAQSMTRSTYFADVMLNLFLFKIVGEYGVVRGGDAGTYNRFVRMADGGAGSVQRPSDDRPYAALGIRAGF